MIIRAFYSKRKQKRYKALVKRYKEFRPYDTVEICENHHEEIHELYGAVIMREIKKRGFRSVRDWTWKEAEAVMEVLRAYCDAWAKRTTPGMRLRKFAR